MTIPNDPEGRWWLDVTAFNPAEVDKFRPVLTGFLAFDRGREATFAGTGFFIAGDQGFGLALTAKHVLQEGVLRIQKPESTRAVLNPYSPKHLVTPSVDPRKLKATWLNSGRRAMLDVIYAQYNDTLDMALCVLASQNGDATPFRPTGTPLDTAVPSKGDVVHMVALGGLDAKEIVAPSGRSGGGQTLQLHSRVTIRVGVVTAVHPEGYRQYKWPCFTTSIPAEPGMSGGLVYIPRERATIGACGLVSADCSPQEAFTRFDVCGESIIASAWPALSLNAPVGEFSAERINLKPLYQMMKDGDVPIAIGGIDHIELIDRGDDVREIGFKKV